MFRTNLDGCNIEHQVTSYDIIVRLLLEIHKGSRYLCKAWHGRFQFSITPRVD